MSVRPLSHDASPASASTVAVDPESRDRALWRQSRRVLQRDAAECPSPCMGVCQMSLDNGLCMGCWRSLDEIQHWVAAPQADKRAVWQRIQERLQDAYPQGLSA